MPSTSERVDRLEQVFASFMARTEEALAEIRANTAEIRASNARTDARLLEMQLRMDSRMDRFVEQAERDREQAEKDRKDFNRRMAELSDSMGTLIEDMVSPNARRLVSEIFPDDPALALAQRVRRTHPGDRSRMIEIDLLAAGQRHLTVFEAKRRLDSEKVREFVERLALVPEFFPEYADRRVIPVIASVTIDPSVILFLNRQKVYGVALGDHTMELVNLGQF